MSRMITKEAMLHDLGEIRKDMADLQRDEEWLLAKLEAQGYGKPAVVGTSATGKKARLPGGKPAYRRAALEALSPFEDRTVKQLAELSGVTATPLGRYLKEFRAKGIVEETTGNKRSHQKWLRGYKDLTVDEIIELCDLEAETTKETKIHVGEGIVPPNS